MSQTGPYDDEFSFGHSSPEKGPAAGGHSFSLPRKSTVAISLVLVGSAFFLARGCWYYGNDRENRYRTGRVGVGHFFFTGGGSGYRGGSSAPSIGGSARGGFGSTGVHATG